MTSRRNNPIQPKLDVRIELPGMITFTTDPFGQRRTTEGPRRPVWAELRESPATAGVVVTNRGTVYSNVASYIIRWLPGLRTGMEITDENGFDRTIDGIAPIGDRRKQYLQLITLRIGA